MPRWKLTEDHYINARRQRRPTEWEQVETDRETGEEDRVRFTVPLYCDKGLIISTAGAASPLDNGKLGPITVADDFIPTPAMEPLDTAAEEVSAKYRASGINPIDSLPAQGGFNDALLTSLTAQLAAIASRLPPTPSVVADSNVSREEFESMKAQLAALMAEKAEKATPRRV